jgi:hypothetical protein
MIIVTIPSRYNSAKWPALGLDRRVAKKRKSAVPIIYNSAWHCVESAGTVFKIENPMYQLYHRNFKNFNVKM